MKFACDSCHAQYMISDDKVGPSGVIVRCKKCQHKILVKPAPTPPEEESSEATVVMSLPLATLAAERDAAAASAGHEEADGESSEEPSEEQVPAEPAPAPEPSEAEERTVAAQATWSPGAPTAQDMPAVSSPFAASNPFDDPDDDDGMDDDIGKAFDSVLSGATSLPEDTSPGPGQRDSLAGYPFDSVGGQSLEDDEDDADRQSTRVVNLTAMASLIKNEAAPADPSPDKGGGAVEWFVAINEQQVGPLNLDGLRQHWDDGELSADSLAWKAGMGDWRPLSTIDELSNFLVPRNKPEPERVAASGALATGVQTPAPSALPPKQDVAVTDWKPSAASALEALVKDELDALAAPKPAPAPVEAPRGGLFDELPEPEPASAASPGLAAAAAAAIDAAREPTPAPARLPTPAPAAAVLPSARPFEPAAAPAPRSEPAPVAPRAAPAYVSPAPPRSRTGLWIALGIGGGVSVTLIAVLSVLLLRSPAAVAPPAAAPVAAAPTQPVAPPAAPAAPVAPVAVAPAVPEPAPVEPPPTAVAAAEPKVPESPVEPEKVDPPKVDPPKVAAVDRTPPKVREPAPKVVQRERPTSRPRDTSSDEEVVAAPPPRVNKNKVDDDFERLFGRASDPAPEPAKPAATPKTVYVPPPAGGALPDKLGQSDIMSVVVGQKPAIKRCIDEQKATDPDASGTLVMRWTIRPNGTTTGIQTRTAEFQKTPMSSCMAAAIKNWKFPKYSGPVMEPIDFPFKF